MDLGEAEILAVGQSLEPVVKVSLLLLSSLVDKSLVSLLLSSKPLVDRNLLSVVRESLPELKPQPHLLKPLEPVVRAVPEAEDVSALESVPVLGLAGSKAWDRDAGQGGPGEEDDQEGGRHGEGVVAHGDGWELRGGEESEGLCMLKLTLTTPSHSQLRYTSQLVMLVGSLFSASHDHSFLTSPFSVHNVGYPKAIGAVSVINHYFGRDDIALGAFKGEFGRYVGGEVDLPEKWLEVRALQGFTLTTWWTTSTPR